MENYTIVHELSKTEWSEFVLNHPNGNIFQTVEMYNVYRNTKNYFPLLVAALDSDKKIVGIHLAVIQKEHSGLLGNFSSRAIIRGGPIVKNDDLEVLDFILSKDNKLAKKKAIYSQFRNMWKHTEEEKQIFAKHGYIFEDHLDIIHDLAIAENELLERVYSKRRYGIRRSKREGVTFSVENNLDGLKKCYQILEDVYNYAKLPLADYKFFENLFNFSNKKTGLQIFTAKYKGKIIGCMLALIYENTIYDFYAGSLHDYYKKYPNDLIPWEVFLWGKDNNYKLFDFGGAGKPNEPYGVRDYKEQYGGELVNWGRFEKVNKPFILKISKIGFEIWKKVK